MNFIGQDLLLTHTRGAKQNLIQSEFQLLAIELKSEKNNHIKHIKNIYYK